MQNFAFKFQAVAEKSAKNVRGYFILQHPVVVDVMRAVTGRTGSVEIAADGMRQN